MNRLMGVVSVSLLTMAAMLPSETFGSTRHVVPAGTPGNTPTSPYGSWETAANDIATALNGAAANDTILVGGGTYAIATPISITVANLTLRSCDLQSHEPKAGAAILVSADEGTPEQLVSASGATGTTLEGFVFRNAKGRGVNLTNSGGSKIVDCTFEGNDATGNKGGGLYLNDTTPAVDVIGCVFSNNVAKIGGGICADGKVNVSKCFFEGNTAYHTSAYASQGGQIGIYKDYSTVEGCTFTGFLPEMNQGYGQAIYLFGNHSVVSNCAFTGITCENTGHFGLVISRDGGNIVSCTFAGNKVLGTIIASVEVSQNGKALNVRNCLFADNASMQAVFFGHDSKADVRFENCTIVAPGKTIFSKSSNYSQSTWENCILLGTQPASSGQHVVTVTNCCTEDPGFVEPEVGCYRLLSTSSCIDAGTALDWHDGAADIGGRPRVVGAAVDIGCYEWQADDPDFGVIRRVVASEAERTDEWADASTNIQSAVDAVLGRELILVKGGTYAVSDPITISRANLTLRSCTSASGEPVPGVAVLVSASEAMPEQLLFANKAAGMVLDGFVFKNTKGRGVNLKESTGAKVLNCTFEDNVSQIGAGLYLATSGGSTVSNCLFVGNNAVADGTYKIAKDVYRNGGGLYLDNGSPTAVDIIACVFSNNVAVLGGGICGIGKMNVSKCFFEGNSATNNSAWVAKGGQIYIGRDSSMVAGCTFTGEIPGLNSGYGQAVYLIGNNSVVSNCTFTGIKCKASGDFGAVSSNGGGNIIDCSFTDNITLYDIILSHEDNNSANRLTVRNCLFANNPSLTAVYSGVKTRENVRFENCTVVVPSGRDIERTSGVSTNAWVNCILNGGLPTPGTGAAITIENCCLAAEPPSPLPAGLTVTDPVIGSPRFRDAEKGDWSLKRNSCCRDKGKILPWMTAAALDLAGNPRVVTDGKPLAVLPTALPDIGCYEIQEDRPGMMMLFR